ncbi:MAG TPA: antibiotic biosynthesis monooxygenase family protein [Dehalococcoidia bacterium]|nr:antibiotic biosynthesis monooxygenase family protein [Dehalococcoidia bacterium]
MDLYTVGIWKIKPGKEDEFAAAWQEFLGWTAKNQPGAKGAFMLQDPADPQRFMTFGLWDNEDDIAAWRATQQLRDYGAKTADLVEEGSTRTMRLRTQIRGGR